MTRVIAFANHKGGVGKTTSVANIGAALAAKGHNTLLIDMDAQQNLTFSFLSEQGEDVEVSLYDALMGRKPLPITNIKPGLDLVPASIDLAMAETELAAQLSREFILKDLLESVTDRYDYILIDCPPSLGLITYNALTAATDLYIPLTAEALPLKGLNMLEEVVNLISRRLNPALAVSGVFFTRYSNRRLNAAVVANIEQRYGEKVFKTKIRENIALAEAPLEGKDIFSYAPGCNGAADYKQLTEEILARTK